MTPLSCSTDRSGSALVTLTGLVAAGIVLFDVVGPNFSTGGSLDEFAETEEIELGDMPPGNYFAYVEWQPFFGEPAPAVSDIRLGRASRSSPASRMSRWP